MTVFQIADAITKIKSSKEVKHDWRAKNWRALRKMY
jgi:hypothetical protein